MPSQEIKTDIVEIDKNFLADPTGLPSSLICPECGGAIWDMRKGSLRRFQCHIGHSFSIESFLEGQNEEIEHMMWALLRTLKDRGKITRQLADEASDNNQPLTAQQLDKQALQALQRLELIRQAVLLGN